jgi:dephospho-CoA kinase
MCGRGLGTHTVRSRIFSNRFPGACHIKADDVVRSVQISSTQALAKLFGIAVASGAYRSASCS